MKRGVGPGLKRRRQHGSALLLMLMILGMVGAYFALGALKGASANAEKDRITQAALAQAKQALIAFAANSDLRPTTSLTTRLGSFPCPDTNNDGNQEAACGNAAGTTGQALRLGRLPWKTLGLDDLRDGSGERLWYAVSNSFKNATAANVVLNSDTNGTITLRDTAGNIVNNGTVAAGTGVVALIIAPGAALTRQDGTVQVRSAANINNAVHFLDIALGEDNATFVDGGTDGFISGPVRNAANTVIVNDKILPITVAELMPQLERRVASEVRNCLNVYAAQNGGVYPWAAPLNPGAAPGYTGLTGTRFGRVADAAFNLTANTTCNVNFPPTARWWTYWQEMVFFSAADAYKQSTTPPASCGVTGTCLVVNPPSAAADKRLAVIVAGRRLATQNRTSNTDKGTITNYLEGQNATPLDDVFANSPSSATYNDFMVHQ